MAENITNMGLSPRQTLSGQRLLRIPGLPIKICTWNVRTLSEPGKAHNAIREMSRLSIDILGISEMRWPGSGQCKISDYSVYHSGNNNGEHRNGVGVIVSKEIAPFIENFVPVSERILLITVSTTPIKCNILQVYAPTADKTDEEIERFYSELEDLVNKLPKQDINITLGDFNAKIGRGRCGECVGEYGLGERNQRGDRLNVFAQENQFCVMNTFFKLPPRRLYTWRSPQDNTNHIVRNQIDYIMVNRRFRNSILSVKTYPGADIGSDHCPLVAKVRLKFKKLQKNVYSKKHDIRKLKEEYTKNQVKEKLSGKFKVNLAEHDVDQEIGRLSNELENISREHLKPNKKKKKQWMTDEIIELMDERRKHKNKNVETYNSIDRKIKKEIRTAKEQWAADQCEEIESLEKKHDYFNLHRKVKEAAGMFKPKTVGCLRDDQGNTIVGKKDRVEFWKNYIKKLFEDNDRNPLKTYECVSGSRIMDCEVRAAIAQLKDGRATGPDGVYSEFFKLFDDDAIKWITNIFNRIYNSGEIPKEWLKSTFIALPKKSSANLCTDYRMISLMSHLLKLFLKIVHRRIFKRCEEQLSPNQFGFRDAVGTREALFAVQVLFQRCRDVNCDIYACFIDYHKAFDSVQHDKLISILEDVGIDDKDLRVITNLYWNQSAHISVEGETSDEVEIKRGVRQGCILSPMLFNLYSEQIFREALEEVDHGILLNGERFNNIRYADDTIIIADSFEGLQELMANVTSISYKFGLELNAKKTKYMVISKNQIPYQPLVIGNQRIERVASITYLGTSLNELWDHSVEIKCRIEKARSTFIRMRSVFKDRDLHINTKMRLLRCYVFSVLLYGVESWTLTETSLKKIEAFEMWLYRRILRISWVDHVTNAEVLRRMNKTTELIYTIKSRKLQYLGHIMRNENRYGLLQQILQGKVNGRRGPGRRRISWLKNLRTWFSMTTTDLFRTAINKVRIAMMIANIRNG